MLKFNKVLCFVTFLFNQSKNNAVLEPRTGHFRGLVGFEAKAKECMKMKLKMYPRGRPRDQGRPRGLHICYSVVMKRDLSKTMQFSIYKKMSFFVINKYCPLIGSKILIRINNNNLRVLNDF